MLKKHTKQFIIALFQLTGIAILILLIATLMLNHTNNLNQWRDFFTRLHGLFFIIHGLFYIAIYCLWPYLINAIAYRQPQKPSQHNHPDLVMNIDKAMHARYYLIGAFLMFELLNLLR